MLIAKVRHTITAYSLLAPGDRVVVAVSGGPDSVCLLSVLSELAKDLELILHIAHLDHRFRGEASAREARFVAELARQQKFPATIESFDVPAYCRERGLSAQAGAREVRYAFLERVAQTVGAHRIATGHTADDQAETLLMRLLRGAGASGLSGIPPKRDRIVRPLVETTRKEVLVYLHERGLEFATDSSNLRPDYTRNRVRLELFPLLERFNPRIAKTLAEEAGIFRDEDEALTSFLAPLLSALLKRDGACVRIDRERFHALQRGIRRRLLRAAAERIGGPGAELSNSRTIEALGFMEHAQTGRAMGLTAGIELAREYGDFLVRPKIVQREVNALLAVPGTVSLPELSLDVETSIRQASGHAVAHPGVPEPEVPQDDALAGNYLWQAEFDYAKIALPLHLRSRRAGDAFHPAGMNGKRKKLQDYFVDEKVPQGRRNSVPLLASDEDIIWVVGMRTDGRFLPGPDTKQVLVVTIRNNPTGERR